MSYEKKLEKRINELENEVHRLNGCLSKHHPPMDLEIQINIEFNMISGDIEGLRCIVTDKLCNDRVLFHEVINGKSVFGSQNIKNDMQRCIYLCRHKLYYVFNALNINLENFSTCGIQGTYKKRSERFSHEPIKLPQDVFDSDLYDTLFININSFKATYHHEIKLSRWYCFKKLLMG
jgi:hypothetical protein